MGVGEASYWKVTRKSGPNNCLLCRFNSQPSPLIKILLWLRVILLFLVEGGRCFYKWWFPLWKCNVCSISSASPISAISQNSPLQKSLCQRQIFGLAFSGLLLVHIHISSPHLALSLLQDMELSTLETHGEKRDGNSLVPHLQSHLFVNHFISNEGYGRNTH